MRRRQPFVHRFDPNVIHSVEMSERHDPIKLRELNQASLAVKFDQVSVAPLPGPPLPGCAAQCA